MTNLIKVKIKEDNHFVIRALASRKINIYNIEYTKNNIIYTISESDIENIPFELNILSYKGYKGLLLRLKRNKHFLIAIILSIFLIVFASHIVIKVEVIHNDKNIRELISEELDSYGVHPLMIKKTFKTLQVIKTKIKDKHPDTIEWLEIIDNGMKYTVRVEERIITTPETPKLYCDIVSKKDALVLTSKVKEGQEVAIQNDYVKKGSTIISGAIKFNEEIKAYTCAEAVVYGNTWYTVNVSMPFTYTEKKYTGTTHHNISFEYGTKRTPIFKVHFKNYDTKRKKIFSIGKFVLYKEIDREYKSIEKKYTKEEIEKEVLKRSKKKILENLDKTSEILYEKVLQSNEYNSIIEMEIFYSVKEIISETIEKEIPKEGVGESAITE